MKKFAWIGGVILVAIVGNAAAILWFSLADGGLVVGLAAGQRQRFLGAVAEPRQRRLQIMGDVVGDFLEALGITLGVRFPSADLDPGMWFRPPVARIPAGVDPPHIIVESLTLEARHVLDLVRLRGGGEGRHGQ